jgi:membrane-associated phospholipid phosphatase
VTPYARAVDALHLLSLSFFVAVALAAGSAPAIAAFGVLLAATAALSARVHRPDPPTALARLHLGWTLVVLPAAFSAIRWLAPAAAEGRVFDPQLAAMDREWFGVDIPRWSEGFLTGAIADPFMVLYFLYFLMPVALFVELLRRGDRTATYRAAFAIALGVWACYMLYLLVPATGPRHAYVGLSEPLPAGLITGALHDFIRDLEPQPYDAFPSCHVILGLLCAWACWPLGGWMRWSMAFVGLGTAVSTVVLRYHYLVDDLAGLVVVAGALAATRFMDARIARKAAAAGDHDRMGELLSG